MKKFHVFWVILLPLILSNAFAAIDPNALVKVTSEMKAKCVEYYHYQGSLYCSTAQSTANIDPKTITYEKQTLVFDDRPWLASWGKKSPEITTVEYIPNGDDINHWNELVTSQFIPNSEITPKIYASTFIDNLKKSGFDPVITMHEDNDDEVLFEFQIKDPETQKQDEIQLIRKSKDGLYIVHYVIKQFDMGKENRKKWIDLLKQSKIRSIT